MPDGPPGPDERLLRDVFGVGVAAEAAGAVSHEAIVVDRIQLGEGLTTAGLALLDQATVPIEIDIIRDDGHGDFPLVGVRSPARLAL